MISYIDGQFLSKSEAVIPITDRGFWCGDGAYATILVDEGVPLFLSTHLSRLTEQCHSLGIDMPSLSEETVFQLIELNDAHQNLWRLKVIVTGGDSIEYRLPDARKGRVISFLTPLQSLPFAPLKMGVFPYPFSLCHSHFKSLAHLNRYYVMEYAKKNHLDDCITQTQNKHILEAAFGNLFWIKDDTFYTPARTLPVYFGVTLTFALTIAQSLNYQIEEEDIPIEKLPQDAYYFRTNSTTGLRPIDQIGLLRLARSDAIESAFLSEYAKIIEKEKQKCGVYHTA